MLKMSPERGDDFHSQNWNPDLLISSPVLVHIQWACCQRPPSSSSGSFPFSDLPLFSGLYMRLNYYLTTQFKSHRCLEYLLGGKHGIGFRLQKYVDPTKEIVVGGIMPNDLLPLPVKWLCLPVPLTSGLIMWLALANKIWAEVTSE